MLNSLPLVWRLTGARNHQVLPSTTMPRGPQALAKALVRMLVSLATSRAVWISSDMLTSTPLPADSGLAATVTAPSRLSAPSADSAVPGRMEPTSTMGLSVCTTRFRKKPVSSMVSVPWVMTTPCTSGWRTSACTRRASVSSCWLVKLSEAIWNTCSPVTRATLPSSGRPISNCSTGTLAAW
ncbi:hypothetical protein D3C71_1385220 [compost metagenome]